MAHKNRLADISPEHCEYAVARLERIARYLGDATISDFDRGIYLEQQHELEVDLVVAHAAWGFKLPESMVSVTAA
jgi:hypothetical protein